MGYGLAHYDRGKKTTAHRVAWAIHTGELPPSDLQVCHRCDNPPCVNPDHLFLGTRAENMADMVAKGRSARGERAWMSPLTEADVLEIVRLSDTDLSQREIGERFGITQSSVAQIVHGKSWGHVTGRKAA
jgi:hypothetical protein